MTFAAPGEIWRSQGTSGRASGGQHPDYVLFLCPDLSGGMVALDIVPDSLLPQATPDVCACHAKDLSPYFDLATHGPGNGARYVKFDSVISVSYAAGKVMRTKRQTYAPFSPTPRTLPAAWVTHLMTCLLVSSWSTSTAVPGLRRLLIAELGHRGGVPPGGALPRWP